jgi:hypothetical protein
MRYALAVVAGFAVFAILVPASGAGFRCFSFFAFEVPCEGGIAVASGIAVAAVVALAMWLSGRRGHSV